MRPTLVAFLTCSVLCALTSPSTALVLLQSRAQLEPAKPNLDKVEEQQQRRNSNPDAKRNGKVAHEGFKAFLKKSVDAGEYATLVLFGDSTISGLTTAVMADLDLQAQEIVYVSNDRARRVRYGCNEECGGVPPGGEWWNETMVTQDDLSAETVRRGQASTKALHDKGCQSGGGLETYVFRTGEFKNLIVHHWGFLPEYTDFCWKDCMGDAMAALKPTAVVWNIGFHLLNHQFDKATCEQRHNPTKTNCGNHKEMVKMATSQMLASGIPTVVYKTTNWLCEDRQAEGFPMTVEHLVKWHDNSKRPLLESTCQEECPQYAAAGMKCYDWFFDAHVTENMFVQSTEALHELKQSRGGGIHILDTFNMTRACCDQGCKAETGDGEHYEGLDTAVAAELASILAQ